MARSFNKTWEHYHVPLLMVLINFFLVAVVYYSHGFLHQDFPWGEWTKLFLSAACLLLIFWCLLRHLYPLIYLTYAISLVSIVYFFWS